MAVYVLTRDLLHPVPTSVPSEEVMAGLAAQLSEAVAEPAGKDVGLQPISEVNGQIIKVGAFVSTV